ncbi:MAG: hypothetical protein QM652_03830 [Legionella sp.]|uniref:hypothetical protein n=1 Tax=Legionella sp. TaxID=459 RepID=UPI0039E3741C
MTGVKMVTSTSLMLGKLGQKADKNEPIDSEELPAEMIVPPRLTPSMRKSKKDMYNALQEALSYLHSPQPTITDKR